MLVTVSTHMDPLNAHIMRCRLEAEGISAFVAHEHHIRMNWLYSTALGGAKVQVAAADAEGAREIVSAVERGDYALSEDNPEVLACPQCDSTEVTEDKTAWRIAFFSLFLLSIPVPFRRNRHRCLVCGHAWAGDA